MKFELTRVCFSYRTGPATGRRALLETDLSLNDGECVGIIGPEGAGKSSLLYILAALMKPDSGSLHINGVNVWKEPGTIHLVRRKMGIAFQFPEQQFVSETVESELMLGYDSIRGEERHFVEEMLAEVDLSPQKYLQRSPFSLSMGEARRLGLAALLARKAQVLFLDEPTAGLDSKGFEIVVSCLRRRKEEGVGIVIVSHDLDLLAELVTRVVILDEGRVRVDCEAGRVLNDKEVLQRYGYDVPEIAQIVNHLRSKGKLPPGGFLTLKFLESVIDASSLRP